MSINATVIELRVFKEEEKHGQNGRTVISLAESGISVKDLAHNLVLTCVVLQNH